MGSLSSHSLVASNQGSEASKRRRHRLKKTGEQALEVSNIVLETVRDVAEIAPVVPFLKEAAGCALAILGAVDRMIKNKCATSGRWDDQQAEDRDFRESLAEFKATLSDIQEFAEKLARRPYFFRFIASNSDQQEIADFQTKLTHATNMFILRLNIHSHGILLEIRSHTRHIPAAHLITAESNLYTSTSNTPTHFPLLPPASQFGGAFNHGGLFGNVSVNNVSGDQPWGRITELLGRIIRMGPPIGGFDCALTSDNSR
ncbi:hypothetical protein L218DRAFT_132671 [Marasmius fiardii PR-910]|nr:hypothetical protein L218DRAFT_132671 [Marasmius fiardii PR-910]